jgi:hypothetical protein
MTTVSPITTSAEGFVPNATSLATLHPLRMPRGGTDRLRFETWDTFSVPGLDAPVRVHLEGHYVIERQTPTSPDWVEGSVDIRMRELAVEGRHELLGRVRASVNEEIGLPSGGRVMAGTVYDGQHDEPKLCVMEGYMLFELPDQGFTVFNKQPIPLQHKITHIPPIGQGGGTPQQDFDGIPLFRKDDPDGDPAATLLKVETHIGAWLDEAR